MFEEKKFKALLGEKINHTMIANIVFPLKIKYNKYRNYGIKKILYITKNNHSSDACSRRYGYRLLSNRQLVLHAFCVAKRLVRLRWVLVRFTWGWGLGFEWIREVCGGG